MPRGPPDVHRMLAGRAKQQILRVLADGEKYLSEIAAAVGRAPQTVDFHLSTLVESGLVKVEEKKGKTYYSLADKDILKFIGGGRALPPRYLPKPPHVIIQEMWDDLGGRLEKIEKKLEKLEKIIKNSEK